MASTYSDRLRIELIAAGDQSGTWGDTTNANLGTLIEESIAGVAVVSMSDSDYTLTANNGVTDEARQMVLRVTGTITATRQVIVPQKEKLYVVHNLTSSGQKIHVKTSAATGVEVSYGFKALVYCNGTDVISVMPQALNESTTTNNILSYDGSNWVASAPGSVFSSFSAGMILNWAGNIASPPSGWLVCDGSSQLVSTYSDLHAAIGYAFGGSLGNFNLPDMRDKFVIGAGSTHAVAATGGSKDAIVVSHNHNANTGTHNHSHSFRVRSTSKSSNATPHMLSHPNIGENLNGDVNIGTNSSNHSHNVSVGTTGDSATDANLPPYVALGYIIKT